MQLQQVESVHKRFICDVYYCSFFLPEKVLGHPEFCPVGLVSSVEDPPLILNLGDNRSASFVIKGVSTLSEL